MVNGGILLVLIGKEPKRRVITFTIMLMKIVHPKRKRKFASEEVNVNASHDRPLKPRRGTRT